MSFKFQVSTVILADGHSYTGKLVIEPLATTDKVLC